MLVAVMPGAEAVLMALLLLPPPQAPMTTAEATSRVPQDFESRLTRDLCISTLHVSARRASSPILLSTNSTSRLRGDPDRARKSRTRELTRFAKPIPWLENLSLRFHPHCRGPVNPIFFATGRQAGPVFRSHTT